MDTDIAPITFSAYDTDGYLCTQVDSFGQSEHDGMTPFYCIQPLGLHARPVDPDDEGHALGMRWTEGAEGWCIPFGDPRAESVLPNLAKGATCLHDTKEAKHRLTLDHNGKVAHLEVPAGSKITIDIGGQLKLELSGSTVRIQGATAVECGGAEQLAKFTPLSSALNAISAALMSTISSAAGTPNPGAPAAAQAIAAFASTGATLITKGA